MVSNVRLLALCLLLSACGDGGGAVFCRAEGEGYDEKACNCPEDCTE